MLLNEIAILPMRIHAGSPAMFMSLRRVDNRTREREREREPGGMSKAIFFIYAITHSIWL